jgi:hypothetical protein
MSGNIGTDVTRGAGSVGGSVKGAGGIRMFTSLPREISLAVGRAASFGGGGGHFRY